MLSAGKQHAVIILRDPFFHAEWFARNRSNSPLTATLSNKHLQARPAMQTSVIRELRRSGSSGSQGAQGVQEDVRAALQVAAESDCASAMMELFALLDEPLELSLRNAMFQGAIQHNARRCVYFMLSERLLDEWCCVFRALKCCRERWAHEMVLRSYWGTGLLQELVSKYVAWLGAAVPSHALQGLCSQTPYVLHDELPDELPDELQDHLTDEEEVEILGKPWDYQLYEVEWDAMVSELAIPDLIDDDEDLNETA